MQKERIRRETYRYLGCGKEVGSESVEGLVDWALREMERASAPVAYAMEFPLIAAGGDTVQIAGECIKSRNLADNLKDCKKVLLFAATLGVHVDRLIGKYSHLDMAKAATLQAAAAAFLEEFCDERNKSLKEEAQKEGIFLRPRFSPGYGDFSIAFQPKLLQLLQTQKRIGLSVTESCMLVPVKSVTAVIGMAPEDTSCPLSGCEVCTKKDCSYRRDAEND